jgi:hypothetical protein
MRFNIFLHIIFFISALTLKMASANEHYSINKEPDISSRANPIIDTFEIDIPETVIDLKVYDLEDAETEFIDNNYHCDDDEESVTIKCQPNETLLDTFLSFFTDKNNMLIQVEPNNYNSNSNQFFEEKKIYELRKSIFEKGWWIVFEMERSTEFTMNEVIENLAHALTISIEF